MAAKKENRTMGANAYQIVHNPYAYLDGDAAGHTKTSGDLMKAQNRLVELYANGTGESKEQWQEWMDEEKWFTATEAKAHGLVGEVTEGVKITAKLKQNILASGLKNIPESLKTTDEPDQDTMISKISNAVVDKVKALFAKTEPESMTKESFEAEVIASADTIAEGIKSELQPQIEEKDAEIVSLKAQVETLTEQVKNHGKPAGDAPKADPPADGVDRKLTNAEQMNGVLKGWGQAAGIVN
jgi:hypothetical protein